MSFLHNLQVHEINHKSQWPNDLRKFSKLLHLPLPPPILSDTTRVPELVDECLSELRKSNATQSDSGHLQSRDMSEDICEPQPDVLGCIITSVFIARILEHSPSGRQSLLLSLIIMLIESFHDNVKSLQVLLYTSYITRNAYKTSTVLMLHLTWLEQSIISRLFIIVSRWLTALLCS